MRLLNPRIFYNKCHYKVSDYTRFPVEKRSSDRVGGEAHTVSCF